MVSGVIIACTNVAYSETQLNGEIFGPKQSFELTNHYSVEPVESSYIFGELNLNRIPEKNYTIGTAGLGFRTLVNKDNYMGANLFLDQGINKNNPSRLSSGVEYINKNSYLNANLYVKTRVKSSGIGDYSFNDAVDANYIYTLADTGLSLRGTLIHSMQKSNFIYSSDVKKKNFVKLGLEYKIVQAIRAGYSYDSSLGGRDIHENRFYLSTVIRFGEPILPQLTGRNEQDALGDYIANRRVERNFMISNYENHPHPQDPVTQTSTQSQPLVSDQPSSPTNNPVAVETASSSVQNENTVPGTSSDTVNSSASENTQPSQDTSSSVTGGSSGNNNSTSTDSSSEEIAHEEYNLS